MRVVGGVGVLLVSWVVLAVGLVIGALANLDCIIMCSPEPDPMTGGEVAKYVLLPIALAAPVAFGGARLLVGSHLKAAGVAVAWICFALLRMMLSSASRDGARCGYEEGAYCCRW